MKVLSQQSQLSGTQSTIDNATVVRLYNETAESKECNLLDSNSNEIGTITILAGKVEYIQKKSDEYLTGSVGIKCSKIAYSPMMEYASWTAGGGGAPSYNTISVTNSWNVINSDTNTDGVFSQGLASCTTVPESGKRVYIIHMCYRLTGSESYTDYEDFFKPSGQGGNATITLGGHTPTYQACAKTGYNAVALYTGTADLNTSGSSQSITFSFNNTSLGSTAAGGWALSVMTYDYVDQFAQNTQVINSNAEGATTAGPLNVSPPGSGTGWDFSTKLVTGVASNPPDDVNPLWTKGSGESDTTYSVLQDGDNGTNEVSETSRAHQAGTLSNITGTMGLDSGGASTGVGALGTYIRFKPTQQ